METIDEEQAARLSHEFDRCAQWIEPSLELSQGAYQLDDVRRFCMEGKMQLWPGSRSAMVTELSQYPRRVGCNVTFYGGDVDELDETAATVRAWAKKFGADHLSCMGRPRFMRGPEATEIVSTFTMRSL